MDHIAHAVAWAIERRETADTLLQLPFYHPTFEERLNPALRLQDVKSPDLGELDDVAPSGA
jgi:dihydrolipoamide dehydrogenase